MLPLLTCFLSLLLLSIYFGFSNTCSENEKKLLGLVSRYSTIHIICFEFRLISSSFLFILCGRYSLPNFYAGLCIIFFVRALSLPICFWGCVFTFEAEHENLLLISLFLIWLKPIII